MGAAPHAAPTVPTPGHHHGKKARHGASSPGSSYATSTGQAGNKASHHADQGQAQHAAEFSARHHARVDPDDGHADARRYRHLDWRQAGSGGSSASLVGSVIGLLSAV